MNTKRKRNVRGLLVFLLALTVVPLVCIIHKYDSGLQEYDWTAADGTVFDFFLYYKSKVLLVLGVLLCCLMASRKFMDVKNVISDKKTWVSLSGAGLFLLCSFLSIFASVSISDAFWGGYEQWEGFAVLFVYIILFLFGYASLNEEEDFRFTYAFLTGGALIVGLLGAFQAFGLDYVKTKGMYTIMTGMEAAVKGMEFDLSFAKGMAYSTLYNPNYVGTYTALLLPVLIGVCIFARKIWVRAAAGVAAAALVIALVAASSFTGVVGIGVSGLVLLVFLIPVWKRHVRAGWIVCGGLVFVTVVIAVWRPGPIQSVYERLISSDQTIAGHAIEGMELKDNTLTITSASGKKVKMQIGYDFVFRYQFTEEDFAPTSYQELNDASNTVMVNLTETEAISASTLDAAETGGQVQMFRIMDGQSQYLFILYDGAIQYYNAFGRIAKLREVEHVGFEDNMWFATGRGYIWSRTFPLLPKHILFGCGADNFVYEFPNNDYVGKQNYGFQTQSIPQLITKPHNMYLQIWVQDGLVALLALLVLVGAYAVDVFRTYFFRERKGYLAGMGICTFLGVVGYMAAGMANDSTITVAPVFWGLLGIGFALNRNWRLKNVK